MAAVDAAVADRHLGAVALGVLLDDDGIGAGGNGRAGEDAHGLPRATRAGEGMPGGGLADHGERGGELADVGAAHGIAVHGRGIERRLRQAGGQRLGQHAPRAPPRWRPSSAGVGVTPSRMLLQGFVDGERRPWR